MFSETIHSQPGLPVDKVSEFEVVSPTPGLSNIRLGTHITSSFHINQVVDHPAGLAGSHQYQNANLAVALTKRFLIAQTVQVLDEGLPETFARGLETTKWPGRCQTVVDPCHEETTWFLDGAHTLESLDCCVQWYVSPEIALRSPESL